MPKRLSGNAGTGRKILNNWNLFSYVFNETKYKENCENNIRHIYPFNIKFGNQTGYMMIYVNNERVDQSTISDCGFDRPLGAYNDTAKFDDGLYLVAEKMLRELKLKPFA